MKKYIGCSGFYYNDWPGLFYPEDLPKKNWLPYYARQFNSVEINSSFYHMPKKTTLERWREVTPKDFCFTMKGSRYVSHIKRMKNAGEAVKFFYNTVNILEEKLGCVLWQLPENIYRNDELLRDFCKILPRGFHSVIEFRHISWFNEAVNKLLRKHGIAFCMVSAPGNLPEEAVKTADFTYVRFHGKKMV
jgi:Uncharacterized conserved protein